MSRKKRPAGEPALDGTNGSHDDGWRSQFARFSHTTSHYAGHPATFISAVLLIVVWAITGPLFGYSDAWQLVINTGTTIITFLMVFLIQNSQNRDSMTIQLKLTELVLAAQGARNAIAAIEDLSESELEELHRDSHARAQKACAVLESRRKQQTGGAMDTRARAQRAKSIVRRSSKPRRNGTKI